MTIEYAFAPTIIAVPVVGSTRPFPVRRVYCVGRNYADHAIEMGFDPKREAPFFFCKPADNVTLETGGVVHLPYPSLTDNFHHEVELVVAIGKAGFCISVDSAAEHIFGYAIGLDMTRRDLQMKMRDSGRPWEIGKTLEHGAPLGPIHPMGQTGEIKSGNIEVTVDGEMRQKSDISKLIWSVNEIIADLSRYYLLQPGDLIFTGTPEGVAPVTVGQSLLASIAGLGQLQVKITETMTP